MKAPQELTKKTGMLWKPTPGTRLYADDLVYGLRYTYDDDNSIRVYDLPEKSLLGNMGIDNQGVPNTLKTNTLKSNKMKPRRSASDINSAIEYFRKGSMGKESVAEFIRIRIDAYKQYKELCGVMPVLTMATVSRSYDYMALPNRDVKAYYPKYLTKTVAVTFPSKLSCCFEFNFTTDRYNVVKEFLLRLSEYPLPKATKITIESYGDSWQISGGTATPIEFADTRVGKLVQQIALDAEGV